MARSHGRILTAIWKDRDFLALDPLQQRLFLFLVSQADLGHAGVLPLRERRWAEKAKGMTTDQIAYDLKVLAQARFVVVDHDSQELLIRSYIRRDGVWKQPNVMAAARDQIEGIESDAIRYELAVELLRILAEEAVAGNSRKAIEDVLSDLPKPLPSGSPNPSGNPSDDSSPNPSGNPSAPSDYPQDESGQDGAERVTGTPPEGSEDDHGLGTGKGSSYVSGVRVPLSPSPSPSPSPNSRDRRTHPEPSRPEPQEPPDFEEFWQAYPRREAKVAARAAWKAAITKAPSGEITDAARRYAEATAGEDPKYLLSPAKWLGTERWTDQPPEKPPRPDHRQDWYR